MVARFMNCHIYDSLLHYSKIIIVYFSGVLNLIYIFFSDYICEFCRNCMSDCLYHRYRNTL